MTVAVTATSECGNPRCTCTPCTCVDCRCGAARLGDLERKVMDVLWAQPGAELTGREVYSELPGYAYTTVATVLDRLARKGEVRRRKEGRTIRFAATGTGSTHTAKAMREALEAAADPREALARFLEAIPAEQLEAVTSALAARGGGSPTRDR